MKRQRTTTSAWTPEELAAHQARNLQAAEQHKRNLASLAAQRAAEIAALPEAQQSQLAREQQGRDEAAQRQAEYRSMRERYALRHHNHTEGIEWFTTEESAAANRAFEQVGETSRWERC